MEKRQNQKLATRIRYNYNIIRVNTKKLKM